MTRQGRAGLLMQKLSEVPPKGETKGVHRVYRSVLMRWLAEAWDEGYAYRSEGLIPGRNAIGPKDNPYRKDEQ